MTNGLATVVVVLMLFTACEENQKNFLLSSSPKPPPSTETDTAAGTTVIDIPSFASSERQEVRKESSLIREDVVIESASMGALKTSSVVAALDTAFNEYVDVFPSLVAGTAITTWSDATGYVAFVVQPKNGRRLTAVRYNDSGAHNGWYDENGRSLQTGFLARPLPAVNLTSKYGLRFHPINEQTSVHRGTDYGAPVGTPVWAAADGTVLSSGSARGPGNFVVIEHVPHRTVTKYFHLSGRFVVAGQQVTKGEKIGAVGTTGRSTGPHLHYEIIRAGTHIDPLAMHPRVGKAIPPTLRRKMRKLIAAVKSAP